jgi:hypothetical protein
MVEGQFRCSDYPPVHQGLASESFPHLFTLQLIREEEPLRECDLLGTRLHAYHTLLIRIVLSSKRWYLYMFLVCFV